MKRSESALSALSILSICFLSTMRSRVATIAVLLRDLEFFWRRLSPGAEVS
jgi:hypothetical protein